MSTDPEHGKRADDRETGKKFGHRFDEEAAELLCARFVLLCHVQADVVHLYDEGDSAVDADCNAQGDDDEDDGT